MLLHKAPGETVQESRLAKEDAPGVTSCGGGGRIPGMDAIQRLADAAETGDVEQVARLLREDVPADARNTEGWSRMALDRAILAGQTDVVRLLLAAGADPNQRVGDYKETMPLRFAASLGRIDIARLLLNAGADPDGHVDDQATPLIMAAGGGHAAIVEMLLDHGANINGIERRWRGGPLFAAAGQGCPAIVRLLLDRGAIPTATALERAEGGSARYRSDPDRLANFAQVIAMLNAAKA